MGSSSSRCAARQEECGQEEEAPGLKASELRILRSSTITDTEQKSVGEQCSISGDSSTKKGLLESLGQIKEERRVHQSPRILSRARTYQVNAHSLARLQRERLGEADCSEDRVEEVQAHLRSYSGSDPPPITAEADSSSLTDTTCRTWHEGTYSTTFPKANHLPIVDLTTRPPSHTTGTEGSPSFHVDDEFSDRVPAVNREFSANVVSGPSHHPDFRGTSASSRILPDRENRRNNGRRFWDALTCAASQRRLSSYRYNTGLGLTPCEERPALVNRRLDAIAVPDEGRRGHRPYRNRSVNLDERRRRFRSQVWALQRLSTDFEGVPGHLLRARQVRYSSPELSHAAIQTTEEIDTRASISRIIMLAEALFQVLDEIHRQSISLSQSAGLPLGLLRAPHTIVESMPTRIYQKIECSENKEGAASQCHICLLDYEGGDSLRVLPCSHEYHKTCIDKWLREVHRVCPLCRRDVCEPSAAEM